MNIWIVNPFDDLPDEAGRPMRYGQLCQTLATQGHTVIWWSSDFSHRLKAHRNERTRQHEGFQIRLIHTPAYASNVGIARLRNHRAFGMNWETEARRTVASGDLVRPDRIVVSLPPVETALHAYRLRSGWACEVVVDIQDAWPETFLRLIPGPGWWKRGLGGICFASVFKQARRVYQGADRISACAQGYLELAGAHGITAPKFLCYHGAHVDNQVGERVVPERFTVQRPLRLLYLGAMGRSYDLATVIEAVARLDGEGCPVSLHLAGQEPTNRALRRAASRRKVLMEGEGAGAGVCFHGFLKEEALREQLRKADVGVIPMDPGSMVGIPNKLVDYCAAGLPVLSCLGGETGQLLDTYRAGTHMHSEVWPV